MVSIGDANCAVIALPVRIVNVAPIGGTNLVNVGRYHEGQVMLKRSIQIFEEVLARNPADQQAPRFMAIAEIWLAEALVQTGKTQEALENYHKGIASLEGLGETDPDIRSEAATGDVRLGLTLAKLGHMQESEASYRRALVIAEPLAAGKPPNIRALYAMADAYFGMGELSRIAAAPLAPLSVKYRERWTDAHNWYGKSMSVWSHVPNPGAVTPSSLPCSKPSDVTRAFTKSEVALTTLASSKFSPASRSR
jgi:tetratricopeptide (TPR) repeat protein